MAGEARTNTGKELANEFFDDFGHLIGKVGKSKKASKNTGRKKEGVYTKKLQDGFDAEPDGACSKIPDPVGKYETVPRPFDCFATLSGRCVVFEAKYDNGYGAASLRRLSDTQKKNLNRYHNAGALACVVWFYKVGSRVRMVVMLYEELRLAGTIPKREIMKRPYDVVKKGVFPITRFRELLNGQV